MIPSIDKIKLGNLSLERTPGSADYNIKADLYLGYSEGTGLAGSLSPLLAQEINWGPEVEAIIKSLVETMESRATLNIFETTEPEEVQSV